MSMVVRTNIMAMNANRTLGINNSNVAASIEKLSSGYRINRAADDAAGLAISEKMKAQIVGLEQASTNCGDGVSLIQTAEGATAEIHNMLNRMAELAVKSANGTISDEVDREAIQAEVDALKEEIDRITAATNFNGIQLIDGSLSVQTQYAGVGLGLGDITYGGASFDSSILPAEYSVQTGVSMTSPLGVGAEATITINGAKLTLIATDAADTISSLLAAAMNDSAMGANASETGFTTTDDARFDGCRISANADGSLTVGYTTLDADYDVENRFTESDLNGMTITVTGSDVEGSTSASVTVVSPDKGVYNWPDSIADGTVISFDGMSVVYDSTGAIEGSVDSFDDFAAYLEEQGYFIIDNELADGTIQFIVEKDVGGLKLQVGDTSDDFNKITINIDDLSSSGLMLNGGVDEDGNVVAPVDLSNEVAAGAAIDTIKAAINIVSMNRGELGALQNRLEYTINNLDNTAENITAANSRIRDTDMAYEMMEYTKNNVLTQAAQSMLAQANQQPQSILQLLQ